MAHVRPSRKSGLEQRVVRRAREAVSALVKALGGEVAKTEHLAAAVGVALLTTAVALLEPSEEGDEALQGLLRNDEIKKRGEGLWAILKGAVDREPFLAEQPFGRGLELFLGLTPSEAVAPLLSLLENVLAVEEAHDEWVALRLLGAVYEASLGWELTATGLRRTSRRVKAMGAVYTPEPVARFIVERTLRPFFSSLRGPEDLEALSVCDPACGGGAFLLEAMRLLEEEAIRKGWLGQGRAERLAWRRRVVAESLNGVDLDPAAVHLTRLALWVASGGGEGTAQALRRSIRRGDALVGAWRGDLNLPGGDENDPLALRRSMDAWCEKLLTPEARIPAVHWELDFPHRFPPDGRGPRGWAAVVGNPPYVGARSLRPVGPYLRARFPETYTGYNDLSAFFFHRGLELLRPDGRLGFIAPAYWFQNTYGEKLRRYLLSEGRLEEVFDFGPNQVFPGRGVHTALVILAKGRSGQGDDGHLVRYRRIKPEELESPGGGFSEEAVRVPQRSLRPARWVFTSSKVESILQKVHKAGRPLGEFFHIEKGPTSGCNGIFTLEENELEKHNIEDELLRPCIKNGEVRRYGPLAPRRWLLYLDGRFEVERYPNAARYLEAHRTALASRNEVRRGLYPWWRLERPRRRALFEAPAKLVVPYRAQTNRFTLDEAGCFNDGGDIRVLVPRAGVGRKTMLAALAVANSAAGHLVYKCLGKPKGKMLEFFVKPLASAPLGPTPALWDLEAEAALPVCLAEEGPEGLVKRLGKERDGGKLITPALALLAERMLALHRDALGEEAVAATDNAIDELVARLFGLAPVEEALAAEAAWASRQAGG